MKYLFIFILIPLTMHAHITAPDPIKSEVEKALSYYPSLKDIKIQIKFKEHIKKSTMQARPTFGSMFKDREQREYVILISRRFKISGKEFMTTQVPKEVLIGWIGHELGHIVDYQNRSKWDLLWFGLKYITSENYIKEAERMADTYAVNHGMEYYILKTKNFILNHADINQTYKNRIKKFYLSPEEIMVLVAERDQ
ncbi:hypothetical protein LRR18_09290 [Mangrovimonas sp. AS39]|uniref:hypothetical protein n=1 Tax=Mangrovimonas futianensis TaxID=2895523 RepID=UPI001E38F6CB|nr:hypothetical protein [Mangrovimonas futianensis]MCF1191779.1 hypothetical protein [Mangrovimonas futianensis]MCF1195333.1 hypothetical protein [Mangrovimonas futianensis]